MERFNGFVKYFCDVNVAPVAEWINAIPLEDWPQQRPLDDGKLRPAMVTDGNWHNFGAAIRDVSMQLALRTTPHRMTNHLLSVVMPGHAIERHRDQQGEDHLARIHVPITTNPQALYTVVDNLAIPPMFVTHKTYSFNLQVGKAYLINTMIEHEIRNDGETPRVHFMVDLLR